MALQMTPAAIPPPPLRDSIGSMRFPIHTDRPLQNYKFSGREDVLIGIDSALRPSKSSSNTTGLVSCTIHGIGGVGKTQVALQYTYSCADKFDAIFWLRAETVAELVRSYAMITERLKRSMSSATNSRNGSQEHDSNLDVMEVREWLETTETRWLLVFDNVDSFNHIIDYIPRHATSGAILVTTQIPDFPQITQASLTWPLLSLSRTEGTRLLFRTLNRDAKDDEEEVIASEISDFVGHLPLALTTIGGYIKATMTTVPEFLSSLLASNAIWEKSSGPGYADESTYSKSLSTVFDIASKNLSADAQTLLNVMAFLNPDMIPEEMLLYNHTDPSLQFLSQNKSYYEIIKNLNVRQLVKREAPSGGQTYFSVHRSLQLSILHRLSQNTKGRQEAFMQAFALVRAQMPEASRIQASQPDAWHKYDAYVPQISSLRTHSLWPEPKIELPVDFVRVLIDTGVYLWQQGLLVEGKAALETAEKCLEEVPLDDLNILFSDIDDVLGIIDDLTGISCRADSLRRRRRALQIRKIEHGRIAEEDRTRIDEVRLYNAEANLGCAYLNAELFEEAETIFENCLVQYKSWTTVEEEIPFEYAKYYNHIAFVRTFQGRHIEAIVSARRACDLQQIHGGPNAPLVQYNRFNLGNQLYHAGELEESLKVNQECLRDRIRVCGKDNLLTLESYSEVGALLFEIGRFDEAR
ncbi:hypothetical protein HO133_004283 [Letharia lupina]|uniref:NB-ARC domain-containing protein n=1 Tax=Letharia lupina TaxID=560253 RepID=A0A8H6FJY2_9LECA|nr:uncharacterized protein HO133_004283 [Letharia lupina]KAF6229946.1 hypothetical protein HO133_004283 [Letharia lupina]